MAGRGPGRNRVRIIGGRHRGRVLQFPDARGLRPSADRVRETLFNWLQEVIPGSVCLDLFAGSGAIGLEAASRGARSVVMVDAAAPVVRQLRKHVASLEVGEQVEVVQSDALKFLRGRINPRPFDVVFLDPPFDADILGSVIDGLMRPGWLASPAWVYVERPAHRELPPLPETWTEHRAGVAGDAAFHLFRVGPAV
ncbi:MAG: 16S rRNA (guanine(966)-N(2))-methyltransferase RsmD [Pseudomonadota bacterium]